MISGASEEELELANAKANIVMKLDNTSTYESWLIIDTYLEQLEKENQELKKQLEVGEEQYNDLVEEKENLQEQLSSNTLQLEEYKKQVNKGLYNTCLPYTTGYNKAIKDKEIQQKEFIKYLEDEIKHLEHSRYVSFNEFGEHKLMFYKEVLQEYKKIIGE